MNYLLVHLNATQIYLDIPRAPAKYKHNYLKNRSLEPTAGKNRILLQKRMQAFIAARKARVL